MAGLKHHLVLGELTDVITGEVLEDTHDERLRQRLARLLLDEKGFDKRDITPRTVLTAAADAKRARVPVDFLISLQGRTVMIVKYGPGSMVSRRRPALAASRLVAPYQIPLVVVTNGRDAEILEGPGGRLQAAGLAGIPAKADLLAAFASFDFAPIDRRRAEMEARILYAYEVDDSCPCDDTVCRLADADENAAS